MNNSFDQALKLIEKKLTQNLDEASKEVFTWFKNIIVAFKNHPNPEEQMTILKADLLRMVKEEKLYIIQKLEDLFHENFLDITESEKKETVNFLLNLISQKVDFNELDRSPEETSLPPAEETDSSEDAEEPVEEEPEREEPISFDPNSSDINEVISADIIQKYDEETEMLNEIIALNERMMTRDNISERAKSVLQNRIRLAQKWLEYYDKKYALLAFGSREYMKKNASINTQEPLLKGRKYFINRRSKKIDKKKAEIELLREDQRNLRTKLANDNYNKYSLQIKLDKITATIERLKTKKGKLELKQRTIVNKKLVKQLKEMKTNRFEILGATKKLDKIHTEEDKAKRDINAKTIKLRTILDKDRSEITDEEKVIKKELFKRIKKLQKQKSSLSREFKFQLVGQNFLFKLVGKSKPKKEKISSPPPGEIDPWSVFGDSEEMDDVYEAMPLTPPSTPVVEPSRVEPPIVPTVDSHETTPPTLTPPSTPVVEPSRVEPPIVPTVDSHETTPPTLTPPSTPVVEPPIAPSVSSSSTVEPPISESIERHRRSDKYKQSDKAKMEAVPYKPVADESEELTSKRVDMLKRLRDDLEKLQATTGAVQDPNLPINQEEGPSHSM